MNSPETAAPIPQLVRAIIKLNNQGASSIENGNYDDALHELTDALKSLRQIMSSFNIEEYGEETEDDEEMEDVLDSAESSLDSMMAKTCTSTHEFGNILIKDDESDSGGGDCSSFVYRHPIHIPTSLSEQYEAKFITISTVIVFNLALASHLWSVMKKDDNYRGSLKKAARLYEYGFGLQRAQRSGSIALFLTATINNLGVVYQQLEDNEMACKCFGQLLSTLMYVTDCQESGSISSHFGGFFRNASILIFPDRSGPSPAA
jgi:tetratricopeptide (TPR) repeat protein